MVEGEHLCIVFPNSCVVSKILGKCKKKSVSVPFQCFFFCNIDRKIKLFIKLSTVTLIKTLRNCTLLVISVWVSYLQFIKSEFQQFLELFKKLWFLRMYICRVFPLIQFLVRFCLRNLKWSMIMEASARCVFAEYHAFAGSLQ